jgi:Bacterial SH3 domain
MKRLLLSLWLVGTVFPGHTPPLLQTAQRSTASSELIVEARAPPLSDTPKLLEISRTPELNSMALQSEAMVRHDTEPITPSITDSQRAPLPATAKSSEPSGASEREKEEAIWAVVIRWATVHSGPSVSAPTVRFYSVGTELQLIDHQHGWFKVLEPVTSQNGWVYEKHYLQPIRGPGQANIVMRVSPEAKQTTLVEGKSHVKRMKKPRSQQVKKIRPHIPNARTSSESVASLVERALRR